MNENPIFESDHPMNLEASLKKTMLGIASMEARKKGLVMLGKNKTFAADSDIGIMEEELREHIKSGKWEVKKMDSGEIIIFVDQEITAVIRQHILRLVRIRLADGSGALNIQDFKKKFKKEGDVLEK